MRILITGSAGFIGFHTAKRFLEKGDEVIGIDNLNDVTGDALSFELKLTRNKILLENKNYHFYKTNIASYAELLSIFEKEKPQIVIHLAAQAGVRYSLANPFIYEESNLKGFLCVLEAMRHSKINQLIYASSSSVYGNSQQVLFSETDRVDNPISIYAATKKSNEEMAYTYHKLFGLHTTGLRFFTVYGPYGRPDMALFSFVKSIKSGEEIKLFNNGKMMRDFTFVDDIVDGIMLTVEKNCACEIFNLGRGESRVVLEFVRAIESSLNMKAKINLASLQVGDVLKTSADISKAQKMLGYSPKISLEKSVDLFCKWYNESYKSG
ncbi:MAG: GDP-mannose 4,6-dehydratase [Candidatus Diapherotrites archaeon]|nr:GDP-mannose 4,6-dehydratase [Candidatus Diapherotrites archaeon]